MRRGGDHAGVGVECLTIIATPGVVTMSRSITSIPLADQRRRRASRTQDPLGRESRPKTTRKCLPLAGVWFSFSHAANAAAIRPTTGGRQRPADRPPHPRNADHQCFHVNFRRSVIGSCSRCVRQLASRRRPLLVCPRGRQGLQSGESPSAIDPLRLYRGRTSPLRRVSPLSLPRTSIPHNPQSAAAMDRNELNHRLPAVVESLVEQRDGRAADAAPQPRLPAQPRRDHQVHQAAAPAHLPRLFRQAGPDHAKTSRSASASS